MMSKKDFIALAAVIREHNGLVPRCAGNGIEHQAFSTDHLEVLAQWCRSQNPAFMRERWLNYIAGRCSSNGGAIKK